MRGCRYTAPPLISTVSVVDHTPLLHYITFSIQRKGLFITPSVPFAERRIITMKIDENICLLPERNIYFEKLVNRIIMYENIAIFGAARGGEKLISCLNVVLNNYCKNIFFLDNSSDKVGKEFCSKPIYSPSRLKSFDPQNTIVVITCAAYEQVMSQISSIFSGDVILFDSAWHDFNHPFEEYFNANHASFNQVFNELADQTSQKTLLGIINYRINHDQRFLYDICSRHCEYFDADIVKLSDGEVFVDGGAYTGDTLLEFLSSVNRAYKKIICFEPDPTNYDKLMRTITAQKMHNIVCYNNALCKERCVLHLDTHTHNGASSCFISTNGDTIVNGVSLDSLDELTDTTFIKLDIEGLELNALRGAYNLISNAHPKLAVCVYHNYDDLIQIPLFLRRIYPNYKLYLRHYSLTAFETICYAIP